MRVREYTDADFIRIRVLHKLSGLPYSFPDMGVFFSKRIVEGDGDIAAGAFLKLNAEVHLVCNQNWRNPAWRLEALKSLHHYCHDDAKEAGAKEAIAFLPPGMRGRFVKRLKQIDDRWTMCEPQWPVIYRTID